VQAISIKWYCCT